MKIFDWYVFKNILIAALVVSLTLAVVILLTQSLRFLELVVEAGASSGAFWVLTLLALPRFFEIILPLSMMVACVFTYNRLTMDSELVVIRSVGFSPARLAKPALMLAAVLTVVLWGVTMWAAPKSLASMQKMRLEIKSQFSTLLFREGVFNQAGDGLTVYIRERSDDGQLHGLMIYDHREKNVLPSTILARRGEVSLSDEGYQVLVYEGARQEYDYEKKILRRLNFDRYTIELPDSSPVRERWQEPDERTFFELMNPDLDSARDVESLSDFHLELHRRFVGPLLLVVYALISCAALLIGPIDRRGQGGRILVAVLSVILLQGLFLAASNVARQHIFGLVLMYGVALVPAGFCAFMLSSAGESFRRRVLYKTGMAT